MTELLERAFDEAQRLPAFRQDEIALAVLRAIEDEEEVDRLLQSNPAVFDELAAEALDDLRTGRTTPLEFN